MEAAEAADGAAGVATMDVAAATVVATTEAVTAQGAIVLRLLQLLLVLVLGRLTAHFTDSEASRRPPLSVDW